MITSWNEQEEQALQGLPWAAQVLYLRGLRRFMDFATGVVGVSRGVSLQSLREVLYVEPVPGVPSVTISRDQIYRLTGCLERAGLVERRSVERRQLIFFLPLADTDNSEQNKAATRPRLGRDCAVATQAATVKLSSDAAWRYEDDTQAATRPRPAEIDQAATPPESGIRIHNNNTTSRARVKADLPDEDGPTTPEGWAQFFIRECGYGIREVHTVKTIPLFAQWCRDGVSVGLVRQAITAAEAWNGGRADSPMLYGKFLVTLQLEAARLADDHAARVEAIKSGVIHGNSGGGSGKAGDVWVRAKHEQQGVDDYWLRCVGHPGGVGEAADAVSVVDGADGAQSGHG